MNAPSFLVQGHIARLFPSGEREEVTHILQNDCGADLVPPKSAPPEFFDRVECAALKLSEGRINKLEGRIDKLYDAIALTQTNWRDLLVSAGFAECTQAYKDWAT